MSIYNQLLEKVMDIIYGKYDPNELSAEVQKEYVENFRDRLIKWKINPSTRKLLGPLQPSYIMSKIAKVPIEEVEKIANELKIKLPKEADMSEFNIDMIPEEQAKKLLSSLGDNKFHEENLIELLAQIEKDKFDGDFQPQSFEFLDLSDKDASFKDVVNDKYIPNSFYMIKYLEGVIEKIKRGEIYTVSVVSLLNNGRAAIYVPASLTDKIDVFDPVIDMLKGSGSSNNTN